MRKILSLLWCAFVLPISPLAAQAGAESKLNAGFDQIITKAYPSGEPGGVALVAQKGKVIYHKAFGMANVELGVPMQVNNVFRIGSITKQFTAIAILQLMEQGKLSLQDDIGKFIPDYPTHGHTITVEHLLTHTSGIKSYTGMDKFDEVMRNDKKPDEFIAFFKNEPMDFAPGTQWKYNNSGYFLLGLIIEKLSGKTYPDYVEQQIFAPLGMTQSFYGNDSRIIKGRAAGYDPGKDGVLNAAPLSMTLPYAAGSIQSTPADLYKWHQALYGYKLVKKETLEQAFKRYKLNNGESTNYGYGWFLSTLQGKPTIEHGGGINGFLTDALYLPDEDLFVAVFSNNASKSPGIISNKMAALAMGKPIDYKAIAVDSTVLAAYPGVYKTKNGLSRTISLEAGKLFSMRSGGSRFEIKAMATDSFFFENSLTMLEFKRDASGKVLSLVTHDKDGDKEWVKSDEVEAKPKVINLGAEDLEKFVGEYALTPAFIMTVTREGNRLFTQATGQEKVEVFAESPTRFFLKVVDAQIDFVVDGTGKASSLILYQGGRKMEAKRK